MEKNPSLILNTTIKPILIKHLGLALTTLVLLQNSKTCEIDLSNLDNNDYVKLIDSLFEDYRVKKILHNPVQKKSDWLKEIGILSYDEFFESLPNGSFKEVKPETIWHPEKKALLMQPLHRNSIQDMIKKNLKSLTRDSQDNRISENSADINISYDSYLSKNYLIKNYERGIWTPLI